MKQERRQFVRQIAGTAVRLYHPVLGTIRSRVEDWSPGAVRLSGDILYHNGHDLDSDYFQLGVDCLDVIFTMAFVRLDEQGLVLRFVDEGQTPFGDRH
ncbi:MAG: hypothetical protein RI563_06140 [Thiohalophilus sp.]|uniref:hypothetical protein n=1 Tax=Thiohalophilus sp. TaxID=3028392 RepID=UPI002870485D|nr:hypothetical protein [Thiohalophilus sp.]MDR9436439.1 hypothetical protein [Thiohalophilus sp.]